MRSKRIFLAIAGVVAVVAVVWLTTRPDESGAVAQRAASADPMVGAPAPSFSDDGPAATAPEILAEAPVVSQPGMTTSPQEGEGLPIDVSPGFESLLEPAAESRRHQQLQSEPRDEAWAPRIEDSLTSGIQDSLTAQGLNTQRVELHVVECRTSGCEIQAVGYAEDNQKPGVDLQLIVPGLMAGSLGNDFDREAQSMSLRTLPDGRIGFLVFLTRKQP